MQTDTAKDLGWQENEALARYTLIACLLDETLDSAKRSQLRQKICEESGLSERTIYRYLEAYRNNGFQGLKPVACERQISGKLPKNYGEILEQAIQLKKEVPKRSVNQIIFILEQEGYAEPDTLKRSTLERHLYKAGYGVKQMEMYRQAKKSSSRRFCKPHRMMLIQGDIKYGPKLPIGRNGAKVQTYLSSAIDDHSRYVIHSVFYDSQEAEIIEDTFHKVVIKAGLFDTAYFDNGKQYVSKQLKLSLAKLGIKVRHAPINSGQSKGKVEKFHQVVDRFLRETEIHGVKTLEELNVHWENYLEEYYHKDSHAGIAEYYKSIGTDIPKGGITPLQEWNRDSRALKFADVNVVSEAFLHHEKRRVDKGACISFKGMKYETLPSLIGCEVEISFDPMAYETITVSYPGIKPFSAKPVTIGAHVGAKQELPETMLPATPKNSRMLEALEKKRAASKELMADAISFDSYRKDGDGHV